MRKSLILFVVLLIPYVAMAQKATVSGTITDQSGQPLPGVNIVEVGTVNGAVTDLDGNYSIDVSSKDGILSFSYVGYLTEEVEVAGQTRIDLTLIEDILALDEVVVIGYQTVKKKDLTGTVSIVGVEEMQKNSGTDLVQTIQGLTPGVTVRKGGSNGGVGKIEIRGVASFTNSDPLYIIDGMIADANNTINNDDVESIQILKDASAAAIYGARAANGVIIITTKKGKKGDMKIDFSSQLGLQQIPKTYDLMNSTDFAAMQRVQYKNTGLTPPSGVTDDFDPSINTDWQDEMFRTGMLQNYNLSASGGGDHGSYFISGAYYKNENYVIDNDLERYTFRINTQSKRGRLTIGENLLLSNTNVQNASGGNLMYDVVQMLPNIPVRSDSYITEENPLGYGIGIDGQNPTFATNPVAVNDLSRVNNNYSKIVGNLFAQLEITDWLSYKFNLGTEASFAFIKSLRKEGIWRQNDSAVSSGVTDERRTYSSFLFEHTLNFNKDLGKHNINGVVGYTEQTKQRTSSTARKQNLIVNGDGEYFEQINAATGDENASGSVNYANAQRSVLGRVNYNYDERYLLTLTGRIDQDSRFPEDHRTGVFPSIAGAWRISNEGFFDVSWVSDLKLNLSYGKLGIVTADSWGYTAYINGNPRYAFGNISDENAQLVGAYAAGVANPDIKWEERTMQNYGIEASLFNYRLSVSMAYYNSLSDDCLLQLPLAEYLGTTGSDPYTNAGSIRNQGVEFATTYRDREHAFKWDASFNFTTISNEVVSVGNQGAGIDYINTARTRSKEGQALGQWFLVETDGLFQSMDEVYAHVSSDGSLIQPDAKPGDIRYKDANDDGQITTDDRVYIDSSPWPTLQTGLQLNASYKKFSMSAQFVGVFGYSLYNDVRRSLDTYQNTNFRSDISPWSETNKNTSDPRIGREDDPGIAANTYNYTDRWIEDAGYLRLTNLEFGFDLLYPFLKNVGLSKARIYVRGENLFTITDYSGSDPDVTGGGINLRGVDDGAMPTSRIYSFGLQCSF